MSHSQRSDVVDVVDLASPSSTPSPRTPPPFHSTPVRPGSQGFAAQTSETRRRGTSTPVTPTESLIVGNAVEIPTLIHNLSTHIDEIYKIKIEKKTYTPICYVLNTISLLFATPDYAIVFIPNSDSPPIGDYLNYRCKPDIVARLTSMAALENALNQTNPTDPVVPAPNSNPTGLLRPSWPEIIAVVEVKRQGNGLTKDLAQISDYVRAHFQYRLDLPVVYGLLWRSADLHVLQRRASETTIIGESKWQGSAWKSTLYSYVSNIYSMEKPKDDSLSYSPVKGSWTIRLDSGESYNMYPFHGSSSTFRTTTVFLGWKEDSDNQERKPLILKQSSLQCGPRFSEGPLYELAHDGDGTPGLARLEKCETGSDPLDPGRVRTRLVFSSIGKPLSQCPSVFELLQVFFDLVVAHEEMCKHDVLHRDISWGNIMCHREDRRYPAGTTVSKDDIANILATTKRSPTVLINDLDHGAQISEMAKREPKGTKTGTRIFIALEVAGADPIQSAPDNVSISAYMHTLASRYNTVLGAHISPNFFGKLKEMGSTYYTTYIKRSSDFETEIAKAQQSKSDRSYNPRVTVHEPRHDVESMFWLLCFALARANPKSAAKTPDDPTAEYSEFCRAMLYEHEPKNLRANRGSYLNQTEEKWEAILHPALARLSGMLHHMGRYLAIRSFDRDREWGGPYHAHQVFKILLFSAIETFQSRDPILLCPHAPRYSRPITGTRTGGNTPIISGLRETPPSRGSSGGSRKRGSNQAGLDADDQKSGKRLKAHQPARPKEEEEEEEEKEEKEEEEPISNDIVMEQLHMLRRHNLWYYTGRDRCVHCH